MTTAAEQTTLTPEQQQKLLATGTLFHALAADPRYRKKVLGLIKEAAPDTMIPELDVEGSLLKSVDEKIKPQTEEFKKLGERIDALTTAISRDKFRDEQMLSDDELKEVEEMAKKEQIGNAKSAVELWRLRQNVGQPRGTRKTPPGAAEFLEKLGKVNPKNQRALRVIAEEEATRILSTTRKAS